MTELTFEEFCALPYKYVWGLNGGAGAHRIYINEEHGLQIDIITKRKVFDDIYSGWKKEKRIYSLRQDPRDFKTVDQQYMAYMEKVCGITQ